MRERHSEYASITLNMFEYTGIYLKKQNARYAKIRNVPEEYIA